MFILKDKIVYWKDMFYTLKFNYDELFEAAAKIQDCIEGLIDEGDIAYSYAAIQLLEE